MDNAKRLQNLALKIILFLVWFDLMCFALILSGNIFKWSFFNESIGTAFVTAFGLSLGALVVLAVLHLVLTLNMISSSISHIAKEKEIIDSGMIKRDRKRFRNLISASIASIILIVGYQGIIEHSAARNKVEKIERRIKDIA